MRNRCRLILFAVPWLTFAGCALPPPPVPPEIDAEALAAVDRMCAAVDGLQRYQVSLETVADEALPSGQLVQVGSAATITVSHPNRLTLTVTRDSGERWSAWLIDGEFTILDENEQLWSRLHLPIPLDEALVELGDVYGLDLPLVDLLSGIRRQGLLKGVHTGLYLGTEPLDGQLCDHVLFRQDTADWQVWIRKDGLALPHRLLLTYKEEPGHPAYRLSITDWNLESLAAESLWKPRIPDTSREVPFDNLVAGEE